MALSSIDLCCRALLKIGTQPITSFEEATYEADVCKSVYASVRDTLLSAYPWSFATKQTSLPRLAEEPAADYQFAYQLPADFLRALSAGVGKAGRGLQYRLSEGKLHSDSDSVMLTYIAKVNESTFPAFFDQALIDRLASEICLPLTESSSRTQLLIKLADSSFRDARLVDSQQDALVQFEDFTLVEVRR